MATVDRSRQVFNPAQHYKALRQQQGRLITDDDFNRGSEHLEHETRHITRDTIGISGSSDQGFAISNPSLGANGVDFDIEAGTLYLGGHRLTLENAIQYLLQPDYLQNPGGGTAVDGQVDLVYLETWQQPISSVEDSELLEAALGGVDTTQSLRQMARVHVTEVNKKDCAEAWQVFKDEVQSMGWGTLKQGAELVSDTGLIVDFVPSGVPEDLCHPAAINGYLGAENQAIRVQLTPGGTFTYGLHNGTPLQRVQVEPDRLTITVETEFKDETQWPKAGQVIELLPWGAVLSNGEKVAEEGSGHFARVDGDYVPDTRTFTLAAVDQVPVDFGEDWKQRSDKPDLVKTKYGTEDYNPETLFLRIWDRGSDTTSPNNIPIGANPIALGQTGLEVTFTGNDRLVGLYWIIAVRPSTRDEVTPWELEVGRPSQGVKRYFTPLALVEWEDTLNGLEGQVIHDCRRRFRPLTELTGCCTYTVGDGVHSIGDFDSIEQAAKQLTAQGGRICVLPGVHKANLKVLNRDNIHITGCGDQAFVHPTVETPDQPIFAFSSCRNIKIDNLTLITHTGTAVEVKDALDAANASVGITIERNRIFALTHAINIRVKNEMAGKNAIRIRDNIIAMWDLEDGDAAIFSGADDVLIHNNEISVVPAPDPQDPDDPRDPDGPDGELYDPCGDIDQYYGQALWILQVVNSTSYFLTLAWTYKQFEYKAKGGIQIGGGSEMVRLTYNRITGGYGNGITLGDLPVEGRLGADFKGMMYVEQLDATHQQYLEQNFLGYLYEIAIENNFIAGMGLSGIGVAAFLHSEKIGLMISIDEITIRENHITNCANQVPDEKPEPMLRESGFGGIVLASCENVVITHNKIQDNGRYENQAVCGVLIVYGEDVDISNNRIINNGPLGQVNGQALDRGLRGGIVVLLSFKKLVYQFIQNKGFTRPDGVPAVKVHDNIVVQPMGQALYLTAFGPVSVVGNQFTTQGADYKTNPFSIIAGAVLIMNLGVSQDLMAAMFLKSFRYVATGNQMLFTDASVLAQAPAVSAALKFLYLPSGNVMYTGNQTTLDLQDEVINLAFSAQAIVSLDDVAYNSNQSEVRSLFDILLTDVALIGATVRANDNRFQEGFTITLNSLMSVGFMNMAATNQATHCIQVFGPPAFTVAPDNSILYKLGPCADYGKVIGKYVAMKAIAAG